MEQRTHVKMFKKGKNWCYMAIATIAMAFGIATTTVANADVATDQNTVTTSQQISSTPTQSATPATVVNSSSANVASASNAVSTSATVASEAPTSTVSQTSVMSSNTSYAVAATQPVQLNGWQSQNGNTYYYNNGLVSKTLMARVTTSMIRGSSKRITSLPKIITPTTLVRMASV